MRRVLSFLLALSLMASAMQAAFAEVSPGAYVDSNPAAAQPPSKEPEQPQLFTVCIDELLARPAVTPFALTNSYYRNRLAGNNQYALYDGMLAYFEKVHSDGTGVNILELPNVLEPYGPGDSEKIERDLNAAIDALIKDRTELLYWVKKDAYINLSVWGPAVRFCFPVISSYQGAAVAPPAWASKYDCHEVTAAQGDATARALAKADEILAEAAKRTTDYEKIKYFNEAICKLTSYDDAAALPGAPYGDASQMHSVFLGRPVVCEGYAKAFKYLCDQAGIGCLIVEGMLETGTGAGPHMWNYVELDGKWYIVDVTNNDGLGADYTEDLLAIGSKNARYAKNYDSTRIEDGSTPLNPDVPLSEKDYTPTAKPGEPKEYTVTFDGNEGKAGADKLTTKGGKLASLPSAARSGYNFTGWYTQATGGSPVSIKTVFTKDTTLFAHWSKKSSGGGGGGGGGGLSGGSSGSGGSAAPATPAPVTSSNVEAGGAVSQTAIASEAKAALDTVAPGGSASVRTQNAKSIAPEALKALADAAAAAGKKVLLYADTTSPASGVEVRLYVNPALLTGATQELKLGARLDAEQTAPVKTFFEKYFENNLRVISFDQQGSFGARLEVAAKVSLEGMNPQNLHFYAYDGATNSYKRIENPAHYVDGSGYLRFHTALAGSIVITDAPLKLR